MRVPSGERRASQTVGGATHTSRKCAAFSFELAKRNIFVRSIDRNPEQNDEGGAFPHVRRASLSDMTCYSAVHLLHFYVSKSLHPYVGGVRNMADLILIAG